LRELCEPSNVQVLADLDPRAARDVSALLQAARLHRQPRLGPIMVLLDNSPVLAAYGMVRSGCCDQLRGPPRIVRARTSGGGKSSLHVGHAAAAAAAAVPSVPAGPRRPSPFQQAQQQQVMLMLGSGDAAARVGAVAPDADGASVARALEMLYYGDQSGLEWQSGEIPQHLLPEDCFGGGLRLSGAGRGGGPLGTLGPLGVPSLPQMVLKGTLSAPCGVDPSGPRRLQRPTMRTIAARHLPLLSARSQRNSTSGDSIKSYDGSKANGAMRWGDVAALRSKVRFAPAAACHQQVLHMRTAA
jgi:hypothetical protein